MSHRYTVPVLLLALILGVRPWGAKAAAGDAAFTVKSAPTGQIKGHLLVKDHHGFSLQYANIIVLGAQVGTLSDEIGQFTLSGVPTGAQRLVCEALGFERDTTDVVVAPLRTTIVTVEVVAQPGTLDPERLVQRDTSWLEQRPDQRSRVGTRCRVHPEIALALDTVQIHHGIAGVGLLPTERDSFPNAARAVSGGCVVGYQTHAEIAYCSQCRAAYQRWLARMHMKR